MREAVAQDGPEADNYIADNRSLLEISLPDCPDDLLDLYTLLAVARGTDTTLEDVHDAWAVWRNKTEPQHHSLIPFSMLTEKIQKYDRPYQEAIHAAAHGEVIAPQG